MDTKQNICHTVEATDWCSNVETMDTKPELPCIERMDSKQDLPCSIVEQQQAVYTANVTRKLPGVTIETKREPQCFIEETRQASIVHESLVETKETIKQEAQAFVGGKTISDHDPCEASTQTTLPVKNEQEDLMASKRLVKVSSSEHKQKRLTDTRAKPHRCTICEKQYSAVSSLTRHMWIHTGEKPHRCDICSKQC